MRPSNLSLRCFKPIVLAVSLTVPASETFAQGDGFLRRDGRVLFPIGFYEHPEDDAKLREMAESGVNLVHCHSRADLDDASKAGLLGVYPMNFQGGPSEEFRKKVEAVVDHPALAVWEGPDEVVWNFTAFSGLHRTMNVYSYPDEWWDQTETAIRYSEEKAAEILPNMRGAVELIRELDDRDRQVWINEALRSDARFVRGYLDFVDITGCDIYPVKKADRRVERMGGAVERWKKVGRGKPVWMVLQSFSWDELGDRYADQERAYPTFAESRFMAYDVLCHGARGILYWGSAYLQSEEFRRSLYALTSELGALQPFLVAPHESGTRLDLLELPEEIDRGVRFTVRRSGRDWLIVLVNEDEVSHMGVDVSGLEDLEGRDLHLLHGGESATVHHGAIVTRMQPYEVKTFATSRDWESPRREGRDYTEDTKP